VELWTLFRYEAKHVMRDLTQVLIVAVVIPLLLAPFLLKSFQKLQRQQEEVQKSVFFVALVGPQAQNLRAILPVLGNFRELPIRGNPVDSLREGIVDCYLEADDSPDTESGTEGGLLPQVRRRRLPGTPLLTLHYCNGRDKSMQACVVLESALFRHLKDVRNQRLKENGQNPSGLYNLEQVNLASQQQESLQTLAALIPLVLIFVFFGTGSVTALDSIAGERERGSLATILVSALTRWEITLAKWLTVVAVSLSFGVFQFVGIFWSTQGLGGTGLQEISPLNGVMVTFFAVLLCLQVTSILLWISAKSTSFKQAQLLYMPALLVAGALAAVSWLEGLPLASVMAITPVSALSLALRDSILGNFTPWLGLAALGAVAWIWLTLRSVSQSLELDPEGSGRYTDNPTEQMRSQLNHDIFWFYALAAALMVILPGNFPALSGLRGQVALNQGIMLILPLMLLRLYSQPLRASLRWRNTSAWNWFLCLAAAPLVHICANSVAIISSWLLPMPEEMVRQMTELLLPENVSTPELLLMIACSPAICEELAFRGGFLHAVRGPGEGPRPRLRTCLLVGLSFGAFHFSLQRLLPTAVIGTLLTFVALRCNSLWPCMLLHLVNNSLAVLLNEFHLDYAQIPSWCWLLTWAGLLYLLNQLRFPAGVGHLREETETNEPVGLERSSEGG